MLTPLPVDVVLRPADLTERQVIDRTVVVFDVLRATTTMTAALAAGVREIRIFPDKSAAMDAASRFDHPKLLCGEENCLPPAGFDLGNSPGAFGKAHADQTLFMSTTNGCKAILAARNATRLCIGALVNASAACRAAIQPRLPITLLCAGTNGQIAMEDLLGAGAMLDAMDRLIGFAAESDRIPIALHLFRGTRSNLSRVLRESTGGKNVVAAGLEQDIDFAARLDSLDITGICHGNPPIVRIAEGIRK